jgi:UTP--glucose-1-phosphate uridylyltransferase
MDRDGVLKPAILIAVEEALEAGIEEVALVVQRHDLAEFQRLFCEKVPPENYSTLPQRLKEYADRVLATGRRVRFIVQETQLGFGHAVWCAREFVGHEPFLLLLGDHLYRSDRPDASCVQQVLQVATSNPNSAVLSLHRVDETTLGEVGVATGVWIHSQVNDEKQGRESRLLHVTRLMEKPGLLDAKQHMQVASLPETAFLGFFGMYVLDASVFTLLQDRVERSIRDQLGMIGLTPVLVSALGSENRASCPSNS